MRAAQGVRQLLPLPQAPFTLVIELDAWNIRARDDGGHRATRRAVGLGSMAAPVFVRTSAPPAPADALISMTFTDASAFPGQGRPAAADYPPYFS